MTPNRTTRSAWIRIEASLLALVTAGACAPKTARRQTDIMAKSGAVSASAVELRTRLNDLADRMSGRIEMTADQIRLEATDRAVRRRALALKADGIPAVYSAAYRPDPLVAAIDVWALAFQVSQYVEEGAGRDAFGHQQALARGCASELVADADAVIQRIANTPEAFTRARARLAHWVKENPVEHTFSSRPTVATFMAEMRFEERDAFAAVGAVSETVETLAERLNTYAALLPRQARWQAELLVSDVAGEHGVEGTQGDIHAVGDAARRMSDLLAEAPGAAEAGASVRDVVGAERRALLEGVDHQRVQTLEYLTAERIAVLAALREDRIAVVETLHQERIDSLKEIDAIKTRAVETSLVGLRDLVDYTLLRVAVVLLFLMVSATALGVVGYRLTVGRHRAANG
jgi:hypothetical protein